MYILLYIILGVAFVLGVIYLSINMENRRHKKRMLVMAKRSERKQSLMKPGKKHLAPSGTLPNYNEDVVAMEPVNWPIKLTTSYVWWRTGRLLQKMPPRYLFEPYICITKSTQQ